jgi:hypothetical protein
MDYSTKNYRELQKLASVRNLKANTSKEKLIESLIRYDIKENDQMNREEEARILIENLKQIEADNIKTHHQQYIQWKLYGIIPKYADDKRYMCKYFVTGQEHDGYCTDAENEPFEPYFIFKLIDSCAKLEDLSFRQKLCDNEYCHGESYRDYKALEIVPFFRNCLMRRKFYSIYDGPSPIAQDLAARVIQRWVTRWFIRK